MNRATQRHRRALRSSQHWNAWAVLIALLFIHAKVAVGGCLVPGALSSSVAQVAQPVLQSDGKEPCSNSGSPAEQSCLKHCVQSADTPKPTLDLPGVGQIAVPLRAVIFSVPGSVSIASVLPSPPTNLGPPAYLRFLRLLN